MLQIVLGFLCCLAAIGGLFAVCHRVWKELIGEYVDEIANRRAEEILRHTKIQLEIEPRIEIIDHINK